MTDAPWHEQKHEFKIVGFECQNGVMNCKDLVIKSDAMFLGKVEITVGGQSVEVDTEILISAIQALRADRK